MKIWLKLIIAGFIIAIPGLIITPAVNLNQEPNVFAIGFLTSVVGVTMIMIGVIIGIKRGFRRMLNE